MLTDKPRASRIAPSEAEVMPLPNDDTTPPVTAPTPVDTIDILISDLRIQPCETIMVFDHPTHPQYDVTREQTSTAVTKYNNESTNSKDPILNFFIERYDEAYKLQLNDLVKLIKNNSKQLANFEDGRRSLILAEGAIKSNKSKKFEKIKF